jgi:hypothetical protein
LQHIFTTYGKITPQQVKAKEIELYNMHFDISQPVDTVFNAVDDLSDLAEHGNSPMSEQQMIDLAYVIFAKQTILQQDLRLWNRLPIAERTWTNMTQHFRDAQTDFSSLPTAGDVFHQQPSHQANIATMADLVAQCLLDDQRLEQAPPAEPAAELANSLQRRETDLQMRESSMMTQMQEMMAMMRTGNNNNNNYCGNRSNQSQQGRGRFGRGRGNEQRPNNRPNTRCYCWTHGVWTHTSADCNRSAPGHKTTATFAAMQGGSTHGCYWL